MRCPRGLQSPRMGGAIAVEYAVMLSLILTVLLVALILLAPKPPANQPAPPDPYQAPSQETEWMEANAEMESMMAAQEMYMESHNGQPAGSVQE